MIASLNSPIPVIVNGSLLDQTAQSLTLFLEISCRFSPGIIISIMISQKDGKEHRSHIFKLLVMICIKFTQDPGVKLFCIKRRLQIRKPPKAPFPALPIWALAERISGPCHSEMSKTSSRRNLYENFLRIYCKLHSEGKALKFGDIIFFFATDGTGDGDWETTMSVSAAKRYPSPVEPVDE